MKSVAFQVSTTNMRLRPYPQVAKAWLNHGLITNPCLAWVLYVTKVTLTLSPSLELELNVQMANRTQKSKKIQKIDIDSDFYSQDFLPSQESEPSEAEHHRKYAFYYSPE